MDSEWPEIVIDEEEAILDNDLLLSEEDLAEALLEWAREAIPQMSRALKMLSKLSADFDKVKETAERWHDDMVLRADRLKQ